uniref:U-Kazal-Dg21.2 n=1 Tax=Dolopus genitalis TaxID=2488630 RepID=KAZL2_DOLGE|nr:RecName: Full=U-Kazal-Dg21.2; Flags: Precursor [Dolopus genitalis]AYV99542.1 venom polypeptide [Dolopus genitalis]
MKYFLWSAVTIFAIVNVVGAKNSDFDPRCLRACTAIYRPVCGFDGKQYRIFASECVMAFENCNLLLKSQKAFQKTLMSFCQVEEDFDSDFCPEVCPLLYKPVCGSYGDIKKIFPNECELKRANCKFGEAWEKINMDICRNISFKSELIDPKKKCLKPCNLNWDPICAFDGEKYFTFGNRCDMEIQTCLRSEKNWTLIRKGEC